MVAMQGQQRRHCSSRRGFPDGGAAAGAPPGPFSCRAPPPCRYLCLPTGSVTHVLGRIFMLSPALSLGATDVSTAVSDYGTSLAESLDRKGRGDISRFLPVMPMLLSLAGQYSFAAYRKGGGASQSPTVAPMPRYGGGGGAATPAFAPEAAGGPQDAEALAAGSNGSSPLWVVREADLSAIQVGAAWCKLAGLQFSEWIITNQKICVDRLR